MLLNGFGIDDAVLAEDGLQFVAGHHLGVAAVGTENAQQLGALAVLGRCDLFKVIERPVHLIAVHMVDLHAGCTRTDPSLPDESVARAVSEIAHTRISRTAIMILLARAKSGFYLVHDTSLVGDLHVIDGEEPAVLRAVKGFGCGAFLDDRTAH